ncbi:MAG TPA: hypothetical protein PKJ16_07825 [Spirochaetota bacterium]|nr:hypothetical protein [Spirochaetota bacterium]
MKTPMYCSMNRFIRSASTRGCFATRRAFFVFMIAAILAGLTLPSCNTSSCQWVTTGSRKGKKTTEYVCGDKLKRIQRTRQNNAAARNRSVEENNAFTSKLAAARPSADQQVFIQLVKAEQAEKARMKGQTTAAQEAIAKSIQAKYKNRPISFRQVCCVNVERKFNTYTAVFYVPDPNAGGGCTGRPVDENFNFYGVPFVVKRNLSAAAAGRYKIGTAYSVSGRLVVNENSFSTDYEENQYLLLRGVRPYEAGNWSSKTYPEGGKRLGGPDHQRRTDVRKSYYGEFFTFSQIITLD